MVNQKVFEEGLDKLRADLGKQIDDSIQSIKDTVIANLVEANKSLQLKVENLEGKLTQLEIDQQAVLAQEKEENSQKIESLEEKILELQNDHPLNMLNTLEEKFEMLEEKIFLLENDFHANAQHSRQNNLIISGIPAEVNHAQLEKVAVNLINRTIYPTRIIDRDFHATECRNEAPMLCVAL